MGTTNYPQKYLTLNAETAKRLNLVVEIAGVPDLLSLVPVYEKLRYGDPRLFYGLPGLVYGGLVLKDNTKAILSVNSGLSIVQKIEPEQGRGSVATMSLQFIDLNGYMSQLVAVGVIIPEPLGNTLVQVSLGYANSSFPDDYYKVFRGYITTIKSKPGIVTLELSDANIKRRQTIFFGGTSTLVADIDDTTTSIPINNTTGFIQQILGPDGTYDPGVTTYIQVDDEYMNYPATGMPIGQLVAATVLPRNGTFINSRETTPVAHSAGATILNGVMFQDNVIDLALKIMLSGWSGDWLTGVQVSALGTSLDPANPQNSAVIFPPGVNVVNSYGLTIGDYVTITGSLMGNDGLYTITDIQNDLDDTNRMILLSSSLTIENPAPPGLSLSFRSQYDTYPISCGLSNTPIEVDVATHQQVKAFFFSAGIYDEQIFIADTQNGQNGKDLIEGTLWLPVGAYSITRYGQISLAVTKPPIAQTGLVFLNEGNIIEPDKIEIARSLNSRRFYNIIQFNYDLNDAGIYQSQDNIIDTNSLTRIKVTSTLPINADGIKTSLGGPTLVQNRGEFILNRYKDAAYEITLKVNWSAASIIEVGDVIALRDDGTLHITNFETGERNLGTQLFEVIQRQLNIKEGWAQLTLLSSLGYTFNQRFATISPSSIVTDGSTTSSIEIMDSYGPAYPNNERRKWIQLIGLPIVVHDDLYTQSATAILDGFDPGDKYRMLVSPDLPFVPPPGYIVDIVSYGTGTDPTYIALDKTLFAFVDPSIAVLSGISATVFTIASSGTAAINIGLPVLIHDEFYITVSPEINVVGITGQNVEVASSLGFTPSSGQTVELVGFKDLGGPYRII